MKNIILGITIFLTYILQSSLFSNFKIYGVSPNIIPIIICSIGLIDGKVTGSFIGGILGIITDILLGKVFGFYTLIGLYLGYVSGAFSKSFYKENWIVGVAFIFISTIVYEFAVFSFGLLFRNNYLSLDYFIKVLGFEAVYNSIIAIIIYPIMLNILNKFSQRDRRISTY
jgi:rod shape-determining protein MreD